MKSLRLDRWATQLHPPRNPRLYLLTQRRPFSVCEPSSIPTRRWQPCRHQNNSQSLSKEQRRGISRTSRAAAATAAQETDDEAFSINRRRPNFPSHRKAVLSAKLSALHARLYLPSKLPLQTLARCLVDPSVDSRPGYSNAPLALLGQELLGYYTSEHLICRYPRLPMAILFAAQYAYVGPATLSAIRAEWGVEFVAAPGPEVDAGLLQLKRVTPGKAMAEDGTRQNKDLPQARRLGSGRRNEEWSYRRGISSRIIYDDQFGDLQTGLSQPDNEAPYPGAPITQSSRGGDVGEPNYAEDGVPGVFTPEAQPITSLETEPVTVEQASAGFVRALAGALYLHAGVKAAKDFHKAHILSRHLELHSLFNFTHPTRDLQRLCAREGFEPPVARLIGETGRLSRTPVFVVGVFSGNDKLGEAAGSSLNEGRVRAAAAALRAWYLYSPADPDLVLPSDAEGAGSRKQAWKPHMIDPGEIVT